MYASELSTRRAVYVVEVNANEWHACYNDGTVWNGGWFPIGDFRMARKVEEISGGRCSVCGQPATEDWQKYMAPRCAAHPHTATGRMVAGEAEPPEQRRAFWRFGEHERKPGMSPALQADYSGLELRVLAHMMQPEPVAEVAESFVFFLRKRADGSRWPVGTKLFALSPLGPVTAEELSSVMAGHTKDAEIAELRTALELARNGLAWYRDTYPDADSGADDEMMETIAVALGEAHDLYTDADKDRPDVICDSNGQVVLGLCKRCGKGEAELTNEDGTPSPCSRE